MPSGCRPRRRACSARITTTAAAPSESWLALPAVMCRPCATNLPFFHTGLSAGEGDGLLAGGLAVLVVEPLGDRDRHDLLVELPGRLRGGRAPLAVQRVF